MSGAFRRFAVETISTKRPPAIVAGKRGNPAQRLVGVSCTRFYPVNAEVAARLNLQRAHELVEMFTEETDILNGDIVVKGGVDYAIVAIEDWPRLGRKRIVMQETK